MTVDEIKQAITNWKITCHRILDLTMGVSTLMLLEFVAKPYYRPFIYSHHIDDFHLADTLGNSLGTLAGVFVVVGLLGGDKTRDHFLIKMTTISFIIYELAQPLLGKTNRPLGYHGNRFDRWTLFFIV